MIENKQLPPFQPAFLKPRYWGLWLGIGIFKLILALPYPMLVLLGKGFRQTICQTWLWKTSYSYR